ncbi:hypothetical protein JTB14_006173 [Gonioctena quinquepunctata]|nr:hypothetical protein JTB14_006173 [Gonioctena quinquepunctata]
MAFILSTRVHHESATDKTEEVDQESAEGLKSPSLAKKHKNTTQAIIHTGERKAMRRSDKGAEPRWVVERKKVTIREDTIIEAGGTVDVAVNLGKEDEEWDFEINEQYFCNKGLICVKDLDDGLINTMTIMNRNNHGTKILGGSTVGWLYRTDMPLEEVLVLCNVEETEEVTLQDHDIASIKEGRFKKELESLLIEYRDVFSKSTRYMGLTDLTEHIIDVGDAKPIKCRPYRVSQKERAVIDEQINEMLMHNIIRPCHSPWASPVVLVKKKDGSIRTRWWAENGKDMSGRHTTEIETPITRWSKKRTFFQKEVLLATALLASQSFTGLPQVIDQGSQIFSIAKEKALKVGLPRQNIRAKIMRAVENETRISKCWSLL